MRAFAANLGLLWTEVGLPDRLRAAAAAGFQAVEFHWPYDTNAGELRRLAGDLGLTLLGLNTEPGDLRAGERGLGAVPTCVERFRRGFERSLAYCEAAGACAIHVMAGVTMEADHAQARDTFLDNLAWAAGLVAGSNVRLLIEPLNANDNPGYFLDDLVEASRILTELAREEVRLQFDSYHIARQGYRVADGLASVLPVVGHVQIAAAPDRGAPDHGEVDHCDLLRLLRDTGYAGWVAAEYVPGARTEDSLGWLPVLSAALRDTAAA